jgi:hypothetical protein
VLLLVIAESVGARKDVINVSISFGEKTRILCVFDDENSAAVDKSFSSRFSSSFVGSRKQNTIFLGEAVIKENWTFVPRREHGVKFQKFPCNFSKIHDFSLFSLFFTVFHYFSLIFTIFHLFSPFFTFFYKRLFEQKLMKFRVFKS